MKFTSPLLSATIIKRYKRFLVDVELEDGRIITAHCPNTGSMKTCILPGWKALLSYHSNPKRKLSHTLELIHNSECWICVNTHQANKIVHEAILNGDIPELSHYKTIRPEVKYSQNSRIDFLLESPNKKPCFVEVKAVTLLGENETILFPDSVTTRGQKHIADLDQEHSKGNRAVLLFLIQRGDGSHFAPASEIDPEYTRLLKNAYSSGLEVLAYQTNITPEGICILKKIPFNI
ncbi:MAG: sugar fermentation stimulation protein A [Chlamydiales bacterium]|jgi:sugar fermentation stimulation protein A